MNYGSLNLDAELIRRKPFYEVFIETAWMPYAAYELPGNLQEVADAIIASLKNRGKRIEDGAGVGLAHYNIDHRELYLEFRPASYYTLFGGHEAAQFENDPELGELAKRVRVYYAHQLSNLNTSPLSRRPQVACAIITADDRTLFVKRSAATAVASGLYHTSIVGGVRPERGDCEGGNILVAAMKRQAEEELGIPHPKLHTFHFFFGADTSRHYQPLFAGSVHVNMSIKHVLEVIRDHAPDKWEAERYVPVEFSPSDVGAFLKRVQIPAGGALAAICALKTEFSSQKIRAALK